MLQALVLRQSELSRGLCVVYIQKDDAVLSLGSRLRGIYKAVCGLSLYLDSLKIHTNLVQNLSFKLMYSPFSLILSQLSCYLIISSMVVCIFLFQGG